MFGNLKFYTEYSLSEGFFKIEELIKEIKKKKYSYSCITDIFNISCINKYVELSNKYNLKPIIGVEVYVSFNLLNYNISGNLTLISKNYKGYTEICSIISKKDSIKNKISDIKEIIYSRNIFILSGGYGGIYTKISNNISLCKKIYYFLKNSNKNFYIEIQRFNKKSKKETSLLTKHIQGDFVATHPTRFIRKDFEGFKIKNCIIKKKFIKKKKFKKYKNNFLIDKKKFLKVFSKYKFGIKNSNIIAKNCNFEEIKKNSYNLLKINNKKKFFKKKIFKYFKKNKKICKKKKYIKRIKKEIKIITKMKFIDYFIMVHDFVIWSKKKNIPIGPGRGSSASSLVSYVLKITDVDPVKYNLFFERFLNKKKNIMPDFDIDFCKEKRKKVIKYIKKKYGKENVFNIVTFGRFSFKNSIRDCGRILGYNFKYLCKISEKISKFQNYSKVKTNDKRIKKIVNMSIKIEGLIRNIGVHAGGIIITKEKYYNYFPLYFLKNEKKLCTQFDKIDLEKKNFVKFDILGLNTLTIMDDISKKSNLKISYRKIDFKNNNVINMISQGNTKGIFQLENYNMIKNLKILRPKNFLEIVNIISICRPGANLILEDYIKKKNNFFKNKKIKKILKETRGYIIFQEQITKIIQLELNIDLHNSELIRKTLTKGEKKKIHKLKKKFFKKKKIFKYILKNSGYSFNKSHAVSYTMITFMMAFLKYYYIENFYTSSLNHNFNNRKKLKSLYIDCNKNKFFFKEPDINNSNNFFNLYKNDYYLGFVFIKGIGIKVSNEIIKTRSDGIFKNFDDFLKRINKSIINVRIVKILVLSGCFDSIGNRKKIIFDNNSFFKKKILTIIEEKKLLGYFFTKKIFKTKYKKILCLFKSFNQKEFNTFLIKVEIEKLNFKYIYTEDIRIRKIKKNSLLIIHYYEKRTYRNFFPMLIALNIYEKKYK
ncbi:DNA polymerase III subunit alpha [Candidatus Vidania fulgoroideorum]